MSRETMFFCSVPSSQTTKGEDWLRDNSAAILHIILHIKKKKKKKYSETSQATSKVLQTAGIYNTQYTFIQNISTRSIE